MVRVVSVAVGDEQYDFVGVWVCGRREVIGQGWARIAVEQGTWGWGSVTVMLRHAGPVDDRNQAVMIASASSFCPQSVVHLAVYYKPHAAKPCSVAKPLNRFEILVGGTGFEPVTPAV